MLFRSSVEKRSIYGIQSVHFTLWNKSVGSILHHRTGCCSEMFCKAACEVFGVIESHFVCYFGYVHIVRQPVTDNKFPRKIQPVVTHELSGRLSRQILHFFVHQTFAYPHCFDEIAYFVIGVLIVFFHNLHRLVQEFLVTGFFFDIQCIHIHTV